MNYFFASLLLVMFILSIVLPAIRAMVYGEDGQDRSRDFNRTHGKYRVKYNDGGWSEPMCHDVATGYASMFGGVVHPKDSYEPQSTAGFTLVELLVCLAIVAIVALGVVGFIAVAMRGLGMVHS